MNYIKLLNSAFSTFYYDDRLNPAHISLYMALFQEWNSCRFADEFYVNRRDLMRVAKIGSKSTYHRCVTELDAWHYLSYFPSNNPYKGSKIKMSHLGTSDGPVMGRYDPKLEQLAEQYHPIDVPVVYRHRPTNGQALVPTINKTKQANNNKRPKGKEDVIHFFDEKGFSVDEGIKFYGHYEASDWKTGDGKAVMDWQALAIKWMERTNLSDLENHPSKKKTFPPGSSHRFRDNLRTVKNKDYGQPL